MDADEALFCDPEHHQAMQACLRALGLVFDPVEPQALACLGAPFHHDASDFPDQAFAVLWLSDDAGWDLVFPQIEGPSRRVALQHGVVVVFDAAQPQGVVRRGGERYEDADFPVDDSAGHCLSWDLHLGRVAAPQVLGIDRAEVTIETDRDDRFHLIEDTSAYEDYIDPNTERWMGHRHIQTVASETI